MEPLTAELLHNDYWEFSNRKDDKKNKKDNKKMEKYILDFFPFYSYHILVDIQEENKYKVLKTNIKHVTGNNIDLPPMIHECIHRFHLQYLCHPEKGSIYYISNQSFS